MIKEIVPYEESVALSQIGFVQSCWCAYHDLTWPSKEDEHKLETIHSLTSYMESHAHQYINPVLAPTYSQAFRWFRENHNLRCQINYIGGLINKTTWWDISVIGHYNTDPKEWEMKYQPYEEAELACLRKLIEIVKQHEQ
jgi:hypothetical protein